MASAARHEFRPQPGPIPQEYADVRFGAQQRHDPTFNGLLRQLDELLFCSDEFPPPPPAPVADPVRPAEPGRSPYAPPGPGLAGWQPPELTPPPAAPPTPTPPEATERTSRHALTHELATDDFAPSRAVYRPTIPIRVGYGEHRPKHATPEPPIEMGHAPGAHRAPERPKPARPLGLRWRVAVAGVSAIAVAGAGIGVAANKDIRSAVIGQERVGDQPANTNAMMNLYDRMRVPADRHERASQKATPELAGLSKAQAKALQPFVEALRKVSPAEMKGVCAPALLAKAVTMSEWGKASAHAKFNNPFGVKNAKGKLVRYDSLADALADQARRIKASPYYHDARLFPGQAADSCAADSRTFVLSGADSTEVRTNIIFAFFRREGFTDAQIAGMVGNFVRESGINPEAVQKWGGSAKGLAQWEGNRFARKAKSSAAWLSLSEFAKQEHTDWRSLGTQLRYMLYEFGHSEKRAYRLLKKETDHIGSTHAFAYGYERPNRSKWLIRMDIRERGATKAFNQQKAHMQHTKTAITLVNAPAFAAHFA